MVAVSIFATYPIRAISTLPRLTAYQQPSASFSISLENRFVAVTVSADESFATARIERVDITDALYTWIKSSPDFISAYPENFIFELESIKESLLAAVSTVLEAVKYLLCRPEIPDNATAMIAEFVCQEEGGKPYPIPVPCMSSMSGYSHLSFGYEVTNAMQAGFDNGYKPLVGMRHLFRAMQESESRFRWIDTTIALELAIKEALIRKKPDFEILLLEMPSPPLHKLYGPVMKEVFGVSSPHCKCIQNGVETRNKLIHRPSGVSISVEEAATYLRTAHRAINHLFFLLYPDWQISKHMVNMDFRG